jgi:hypothetical protein
LGYRFSVKGGAEEAEEVEEAEEAGGEKSESRLRYRNWVI